MKVKCLRCNTEYNISIDKIPAGGATATCKKCGNKIKVSPPSEGKEKKDRHIESQSVSPVKKESKAIEESKDQEKVIFKKLIPDVPTSKTETILAILLSIFVNTVLWVLGMSIGLFLLRSVSFIFVLLPLTALATWTLNKIKSRRLQTVLISIVLALLVGRLYAMIVKAGGPVFLPFISIFLGGIVTGSIRYEDYLEPMRKKVIRYGFLVLVALCASVSAFLGLAFYAARIDIPLEYLQPPRVAEGWIFKGQPPLSFKKQVNYQKGASLLEISASRFAESPRRKEEYKIEIDMAMKGLKAIAFADMPADMTAKLTREEMIKVNGHPRYMFRYDFGYRGKALPLRAWVWYFWHCANLQTNVTAVAYIKDTPVEKYISEVEEMVSSLKCP